MIGTKGETPRRVKTVRGLFLSLKFNEQARSSLRTTIEE